VDSHEMTMMFRSRSVAIQFHARTTEIGSDQPSGRRYARQAHPERGTERGAPAAPRRAGGARTGPSPRGEDAGYEEHRQRNGQNPERVLENRAEPGSCITDGSPHA
jgi:hypothetical protein